MSNQMEEDCKVCKKLFTSKQPNIMADDVHKVIKCMASDVDSSDSCSEKSHGIKPSKSPETVKVESPGPQKRLGIKTENAVKLLSYDAESSDSCSEKGHKSDSVKSKDNNLAAKGLVAKPPKVKPAKSVGNEKNQLDAEKSSAKHLSRERRSRSHKKVSVTQVDNNGDKESQDKQTDRAHLQTIIDEAMNHFQKLAAKPTVSGDLKRLRAAEEEAGKNNISTTNAISKVMISETSVESERVMSPDRPSSREDTISPICKHVVTPGTDNRSSPNGSFSSSRRKLPQPPMQGRLRCSVTSLVHSSVDSDSSRPNSSADFSDRSDSSSISKSDNSNNVANISVYSSVPNKNMSLNEAVDHCTERENKLVKQTHKNTSESAESIDKTDSVKEDTKMQQLCNKNVLESTWTITMKTEQSGKVTESQILHVGASNELNESAMSLNETDISSSDSKTDSLVGMKDDSLLNLDESDLTTVNSSNDTDQSSAADAYAKFNCESDCAIHDKSSIIEDIKLSDNKHVTRSPSYRKKVMAKARSRYHTQLKALKCKTGECKGNCSVCGSQNLEKVHRSHTSLGMLGEGLNEEDVLDQASPRRAFTPDPPPLPLGKNSGSGQRSLKKVPVSSRVDILMSNNLFKKHLSKHADLLQKHTLSYRKFGMQKAVSNLDLSEGYVFDGISVSEDTKTDENSEEVFLNSSLTLTSSKPKHNSRRYSLTGEEDFSISKLKENKKNTEEPEGSDMKSNSMIPSFSEYRSSTKSRHSSTPSFSEFRQNRSQKRRILPSNTAIKQSVNDSSQNRDESVHNYSAAVTDKENNAPVSEVSELSYINSQLDTIDETVIHEDKKKLEGNTKLPDSITPHIGKEEVIVMAEVVQSESRENEATRTKMVSKKTAQCLNTSASNCTIKSDQNVGERLLVESLDTEDKSPLSTSELDGSEFSSIRLNSETDSVGSQDMSYSDLSSSELSNKSATKDGRMKGAKRPRSLISKKSSLVSLIKENESNRSQSPVTNRPVMKRGASLNNLSKSDSKRTVGDLHDLDRSDSVRSAASDGSSERNVKNTEFDVSQYKMDNSDNVVQGDHTVKFTLETHVKSEVSHDVKDPDMLFLAESVTSESAVSEVCGDNELFNQTFEFEVSDDMMERPKASKDDSTTPVFRSTSDACDATPEALKKRRERKERPYKSDPFSGTEIIPASKRYYIREERARLRQHKSFANSSREEILDFLDVVSSKGQLPNTESFPSLEELNEDDEQNLSVSDVTTESAKKIRNVLRSASTTSTDSGVIGQEESHDSVQSSPCNTLTRSERMSWPEFRHQEGNQPHISASCSDLTRAEMEGCLDCGHVKKIDNQSVLQICSRCYQRGVERKKTLQEIIETEVNYGRDLNILKEEFYIPMQRTCLLNKDQLDSIFLNLDELIHVNTYFLGKLRAAVNAANHNNDEDLQNVRIGSLFLESSSMFLTFESYCVNQAQAPILLEQLEREKELLRIFLHVSQSDNHLLRRMHLKSFLMVPVQRIMKYPMLLDRLYKATPSRHDDKDAIKEAKEKIEDILGHINAKSKVSLTGSIKQSHKRKLSERHCSMNEKIEVLRVALESLGWSRKDVCDVITSRLQIAVPVDHLWAAKKCKNLKFTSALGVLLTHGEPSFEQSDKNLVFPNSSSVRSAAVVLIREKNGKFQIVREPLMLERCVVSQDPDFQEVFEVLEWSKESLLIKADSQNETNQWVVYLRQQMQQLGCWRKRRNALPNILLNHLAQ